MNEPSDIPDLRINIYRVVSCQCEERDIRRELSKVAGVRWLPDGGSFS